MEARSRGSAFALGGGAGGGLGGFDGTNVRFTFGLPCGNDGSQGQPGNNGSDGGQGPQGAQGAPFAQAVVDSLTTLDPGQQATVQTNFDGSNVRFQFGTPRGSVGSSGSNGSDGGQGPQGPPGEITQAQLNSAISGTSNNTNGVSTLGQSADGSYNQTQMQDLLNKMVELINALRR